MPQFDRHALRLGVAHDVGECLLGDAETGGFEVRGQPRIRKIGTELHAEAAALGGLVGHPTQRRRQPQVVAHRRPQRQRQAPHLLDGVLNETDILGIEFGR